MVLKIQRIRLCIMHKTKREIGTDSPYPKDYLFSHFHHPLLAPRLTNRCEENLRKQWYLHEFLRVDGYRLSFE